MNATFLHGSQHATNWWCTAPSTWLTHELEKNVGYKVLHFINNEDQETLGYKTLRRKDTIASFRKNKTLSDVCGDPCPLCKNAMFFDLSLVLPSNVGVEGATYIVTDDLEVKPLSKFSMMTLLNQIGVNEVGAIEEKRKAVDLGNVVCQSFFAFFMRMT